MSRLSHLQALEAESIHIIREVASEFQRPVMLYSIGKDSSVMVRLAQKAFHPGPSRFRCCTWTRRYKFKEMIEFRDRFAAELGVKLIVHSNTSALEAGANPFRLGTERCCGLLKTQSLLDALRAGGLRRGVRRGAARRGKIARQGADLLLPRFAGPVGSEEPASRACGTSSTAAWSRARASACFRFRIGPRWTCGSTFTWRTSPSCRCISRKTGRCWCGEIR